MEYKSSCCSSRKYTSGSPAATTPKKEPVVTPKKEEDVKPKVDVNVASQAVPVAKDIKTEVKETAAVKQEPVKDIKTEVKENAAVKQEPVKVNVGVRGGCEPSCD